MRYLLRPGLSGWAQVNYPYGASVNDSNIKLSFDLYYISNYSFWLDLLSFLEHRLVVNARGSKALLVYVRSFYFVEKFFKKIGDVKVSILNNRKLNC